MTIAYLGLGTNLGDRMTNLAAAREALAQHTRLLKVSSIYETTPWGYIDQPDFLNQVVALETDLTPLRLLNLLKKMEVTLGRKVSFLNGPRQIDLDILLFGNSIINTRRLHIPHPMMTERSFVMVPMAEIAPDVVHPVTGKTMRQHLAELPDTSGVRRCA